MNSKYNRTIIIIVILLLVGVGIGIFAFSHKKDNFKEIIYQSSSQEYIKFNSQTDYEITDSKGEKTEGKYTEDNEKITLDNSKVIYKKDDYLLVKNELDTFTIYYDSTKYDDFIKDIKSSNLKDYLLGTYSKELKALVKNIEFETVSNCYKKSVDDENFTCLASYKIFIENYDSSKCSKYEEQEQYIDIFAGSSPECKKDYILKQNLFEYKKSNNKYETTNSFTGM